MAQKPDQPGDVDTPSPSEFRTLQEIRDALAERKQVAVFWSAEDVQAVRPDLSLDQSWEVLQRAEDRHDPAIGVNFNSLGVLAEKMFPQLGQDWRAEDGPQVKAEMPMEDRGVKYEDEVERFFDHIAGQAASPKPAEAARQPEGQQERQVSPADLQERPRQSKPEVSPDGLDMPADAVATGEAAAAAWKAQLEEPAVDVSREELGRLPTQDPPRLRPKL